MELWSEIRRKVLVEGVSKREICRDYKMGWRTVDKIVEHAEPPGYRSSVRRAQPKLGPFIGLIDEMLEADRNAPPKQRHTARRIFIGCVMSTAIRAARCRSAVTSRKRSGMPARCSCRSAIRRVKPSSTSVKQRL